MPPPRTPPPRGWCPRSRIDDAVVPSCRLSRSFAATPPCRLAVSLSRPACNPAPNITPCAFLRRPREARPSCPSPEIIPLRLAAKLDYLIYEGAISIYPLPHSGLLANFTYVGASSRSSSGQATTLGPSPTGRQMAHDQELRPVSTPRAIRPTAFALLYRHLIRALSGEAPP